MKKYKKDKQRSSLMTVLIVFYLFLSLFLIMIGMISFLKISNIVLTNQIQVDVINTKLSLLFYVMIIMFIGVIMLMGSIAGIVSLIKLEKNWLLFAIIVLIVATLLFVVMDGYFSALYGIMDYFNYFVNILTLIISSSLLIYGYKKQNS